MSVPTTAQVLKWESHGNPTDVLSLQEIPLKACGPTEVLVRLLAAPVNPRCHSGAISGLGMLLYFL